MSDELRLNSFLIEIGFSVCPGLAASQILHHLELDKTELFRQTLQTALTSPSLSVVEVVEVVRQTELLVL